MNLVEADSLELLVLVDNVTDNLSSNPSGVQTEWSFLLGDGRLRMISGSAICGATHGLSVLLTARVGERKRTLLFDAGPVADTFERNCRILGVDFAAIEAVVLSHGHWDHAGGLLSAVHSIARARGSQTFTCHVHPEMFGRRAMRRADGFVYDMERVPDPEKLSTAGAKVVNTREADTVCDVFYVSGEIPRVTAYEEGVPNQLRRNEGDTGWIPDPLVMDERFVAVRVKGKGLMVLSACSHAGIVNVLKHARERFPAVPLHGALGGLHLAGINERVIPQTIADLGQFSLALLAAGHCTGWRATNRLAQEFGDALVPTAVGKRYVIQAGAK